MLFWTASRTWKAGTISPAAKNPKWKAIYEPWKKFLDDEGQWFRVNEQQFDNYMLSVKKS